MKVKRRHLLQLGAAGLLLATQNNPLLAADCACDSSPKKTEQKQPYRIFMILYRGETAVEKGFRAYMAERNIQVEWIVRDVALDIRKVPGLIAEAREMKADLIYTWGSPVTLAVAGRHLEFKPATHITDIPVVFTMVAAPVSSGLVESMNTSGRNITGTSHVVPIDHQLDAMRTYRAFQRLAVLYNPAEPNSALIIKQLQQAAQRDKFQLLAQPITLNAQGQPVDANLPQLIETIAKQKPQLLYLGPDSFIAANRKVVTETALKYRLPTFSATEIMLRDGKALFGLVSRYENVGRLTARKAEQILVQKTRPQDIPIETLARYSYIVNMAVASQLGHYPPLKVVNYAEIIQ